MQIFRRLMYMATVLYHFRPALNINAGKAVFVSCEIIIPENYNS